MKNRSVKTTTPTKAPVLSNFNSNSHKVSLRKTRKTKSLTEQMTQRCAGASAFSKSKQRVLRATSPIVATTMVTVPHLTILITKNWHASKPFSRQKSKSNRPLLQGSTLPTSDSFPNLL